jgi:hypothetical protein
MMLCMPPGLTSLLTPAYRAQHPLSAVQAFAVCLSAFDTKLACR